MRLTLWNVVLVCAAFFAFDCVATPELAQAQFRIGGFRIRIPHARVPRAHSPRVRSSRTSRSAHRSRGRRGGDSDSDLPPPSRSQRDAALAAIAPATREQTAVLRSAITASVVIGVVGAKAQNEVGQTFSSEGDRDYTAMIERILQDFADAQNRANDRSRGDVTAHAIEQSLERAFKDANLERFESFLGENWSAERLRVLILKRVQTDLRRLFDGNNRGNAPMSELDGLIQRSAKAVYRRVFEISELLAANRSSALFVQRLYQTHGGLVDDQLREVADRMVNRASNTAIGRFEAALRRDDNGFTLRYRAQRIVLDCLSDNVERISSSETGIATIGEIEQRISDTADKTCSQWLVQQYGQEGDKLSEQQPVPLRVIWSATGPKDDPSMYGRASGAL
jgi:hypothetical protein